MLRLGIWLLVVCGCTAGTKGSVTTEPTQPGPSSTGDVATEGVVFIESPANVSVGTESSVVIAVGEPQRLLEMPLVGILVPQLVQVWQKRKSCKFQASRIELAVDYPDERYGFVKGDVSVKKVACASNTKVIKTKGKPNQLHFGALHFQDVPGGVVFFTKRFPKKVAPPLALTKLLDAESETGVSMAALSPKDQLALTYSHKDKATVGIRLAEAARTAELARDLTQHLAEAAPAARVTTKNAWTIVEAPSPGDIAPLVDAMVANGTTHMFPLLEPGDLVFSVPTEPTNLRAGMLVTLQRDGKTMVRRIAAVPGDTVVMECADMQINGQVIEQRPIGKHEFYGSEFDTHFAGGALHEETLGDATYQLLGVGCVTSKAQWKLKGDQYFVLADNRISGVDSRTFGPVSRDDIVGVAWFVAHGAEKGTFSAKRAQLLH